MAADLQTRMLRGTLAMVLSDWLFACSLVTSLPPSAIAAARAPIDVLGIRGASPGTATAADTSAAAPMTRARLMEVDSVTPAAARTPTLAANAPCVQWSTLVPGDSLFRTGVTAVYDPVRQRMVVFGGIATWGVLNDVWVQNLSGTPSWTKLETVGMPPSPRFYYGVLYDSVRDRLVVFGGLDASSTPRNDVWALSLAGKPTWTQIETNGAPPRARSSHSVIYDPLRDRMIVFGGYEGHFFLNDIWELPFDSATWRNLDPDGPPPIPRDEAGAFYDPIRDRLLIYGGNSNGSLQQDLLSLSLSGPARWTSIPFAIPPPATYAPASIYDPVRDRLLFFGGYNNLLEISFTSDTAAWHSLTASNPPPPRWGHTAIYDANRDRMIVFGGFNPEPIEETWSLALNGPPVWSQVEIPSNPPLPRDGHSAIYDPPRQRMIVFGGEGFMADLWGLSLSSPATWSRLSPAGTPPSGRFEHTAIFDPVRDRMIIFGGRDPHVERGQVWALSLDGPPVWSEISTTGSNGSIPDGRDEHTAIYDPVRDRMIIFGGEYIAGPAISELWSLDLSGNVWSRLIPTGKTPPALLEHSAIYDPVRDRMLVFGGEESCCGTVNTIWALALDGAGSWSLLTTAGTPPPLINGSSAVYDPARDRVILFGGRSVAEDAYVLDLSSDPPEWSVANAYGDAHRRFEHSAVFDVANDRMIVFGGYNDEYDLLDDVIEMTVPTAPTLLTIALEPASGGTVVTAPIGSCFPGGTTVTLTATPNLGYAFTGWTGDASGSANPLTVTMNAAKNIVANFTGYVISTHSLPTDAGHVSRDPFQSTYAPGSLVTLTATPSVGYAFSYWSGDASGTQNPLVVVADRRKSITANYIGYEVVVSTNPSGAGTVTKSPDQATYAPGTSVVITATAIPGNVFSSWSGDASGAINPLTLVVDGPKAVEANFVSIPPTCGGWSVLDTLSSPPGRRLGASVYDPVRKRMILFGGFSSTGGGFLNDLWALSLETMTWSPVMASGTPPSPRDGSSMGYDSMRDRLILLGGNDRSGYLDDAWNLSLSGAPSWAPLTVSGSTSAPRFLPSIIYDPVRDRVLQFGGFPFNNELWELTLSGATASWKPFGPSGPPPDRYAHSAIYDPVRDRMLIFGGANSDNHLLQDAWSLDLSGAPVWQELKPSGALPPPRFLTSAVYDAARDRVILFGGAGELSFLNDTWALSLKYGPAWADLTPYSGPAPQRRGAHSSAFDPIGDELIVFGGVDESDIDFNNAARLAFGNGNALDIAIESPAIGTVTRTPNQGCYSPGAIATLTATPASGYRFTGWRGDAVGNANPLSLVMDGYKMVIAHFDSSTTGTLLAQFEATTRDQGIELRWRFGAPERVAAAVVERAETAPGPWIALSMEMRDDAGTTVVLDRTAEPGREYFYRLSVTLRDGSRVTFGPVSSSVSERITESTITHLAPNPSDGPTQIQYEVACSGRVRIVFVDLAGRVVTTVVDRIHRPGRYSAAWDGSLGSGRAPIGMYFVRLMAPDRTLVRKLAILR